MAGKLEGKVALVTGGGAGIGRGIGVALASEGADVAICGRTESKLQSACEELRSRGKRALGVVCDVTKREQLESLVQQVVAKFGTIDVLVNNAASIPAGTLLDTDEATLLDAFATGPFAALNLMCLCHPHLAGGGSVVNVTSGAAYIGEAPLRAVYASTKSALNVFSRAAAVEWGHDGIRVNSIVPLARSDSWDNFAKTEPEFAMSIVDKLALPWVGDPETDIGPIVAFLASSEAKYVTGAVVACDGGTTYVR